MNKNNSFKSLQNTLDEKLISQVKKIRKKYKSLSGNNSDYIYKIILTVFGFLALYELSQWLIQHYTFQKAIALFTGLTVLYFFIKAGVKKSLPSKILAFLRKHKENFVYGAFTLYFLIFLATFIFKVSDIFKYATYLMMAIYLLFKPLGFSIDHELPKIKLNNSVFLRLMIISMSIMLVIAHYILSAYDVTLAGKSLYIVLAILYLALFTFFFGEGSFKDVLWYFKSRKFKRFVASNTYNILSVLVIFLTLTGLAYKFGYFDGILKKTQVEVIEEVEIEQLPVIEEVDIIEEIPTTRRVIKRISDVYLFTNRLEVGSQGDEVSKLQEFLKSMRYLEAEPTRDFDEETRLALTSALREKCDWPESTRGILGVQAMACINSLEVEIEEDIPADELISEDNQEIVEEETENPEVLEETPEVEIEEVIDQPVQIEEEIIIEETPVVIEQIEESVVPVIEESVEIEEVITPIVEIQPVQEEIESLLVPEPIVEEAPEVIDVEEEILNATSIKRVSDLYIFTETLQAGNTGNQVSNLQDVLSVLGYYRGEINSEFDEETRISLRNALIEKCNWPQSTKGILGPQARSCINTIAIPLP